MQTGATDPSIVSLESPIYKKPMYRQTPSIYVVYGAFSMFNTKLRKYQILCHITTECKISYNFCGQARRWDIYFGLWLTILTPWKAA